MNAGQREREEREKRAGQLVQKMESWLRAHFDGKSAEMADEAMENLLWQTGKDWLINRRLPVDNVLLKEAVKEAVSRYKSNWAGKEQGEDDRSHALGRPLDAGLKNYSTV